MTIAQSKNVETSAPTLSLERLRKSFRNNWGKRTWVVDNISCHFPAGKCTGLLGHNGAGKTTSIRMILDLIRPDSGLIALNNKPLTLADRQHIGYMPEVGKLPGGLTAQEVLRFHLHLFARERMTGREAKERMENLLKATGLWDHRHKRVGQLSKGLGRRLAWAQAIVHFPTLIILDEPFSGLDPLGQRLMQGWIEDLKKTGVTIVLCTHELWAAREICDHVNIFRRGQLVFSDTDHPANRHAGSHTIQVTGITASQIESMVGGHQPGAIDSISQQGHLITLRINDYGLAAQWLKRLIERDCVVTKYAMSPKWDESELIKYFDLDGGAAR